MTLLFFIWEVGKQISSIKKFKKTIFFSIYVLVHISKNTWTCISCDLLSLFQTPFVKEKKNRYICVERVSYYVCYCNTIYCSVVIALPAFTCFDSKIVHCVPPGAVTRSVFRRVTWLIWVTYISLIHYEESLALKFDKTLKSHFLELVKP